jgi:hypothetical protein
MNQTVQAPDGIQHLRRFMRPRQRADEQCELCGQQIGNRHPHLLDLTTRKIVCGCDACAILFCDQAAGGYRRIPSDLQLLGDFAMDDLQWQELSIPINMAFIIRVGAEAEPIVFYPSPGGATQAHIDCRSWQSLVDQNPALRRLTSDVQALLINRLGKPHEYYIAPIDECYRLTGLIRTQWKGFSGGKAAWGSIAEFFSTLRGRAARAGATDA